MTRSVDDVTIDLSAHRSQRQPPGLVPAAPGQDLLKAAGLPKPAAVGGEAVSGVLVHALSYKDCRCWAAPAIHNRTGVALLAATRTGSRNVCACYSL